MADEQPNEPMDDSVGQQLSALFPYGTNSGIMTPDLAALLLQETQRLQNELLPSLLNQRQSDVPFSLLSGQGMASLLAPNGLQPSILTPGTPQRQMQASGILPSPNLDLGTLAGQNINAETLQEPLGTSLPLVTQEGPSTQASGTIGLNLDSRTLVGSNLSPQMVQGLPTTSVPPANLQGTSNQATDSLKGRNLTTGTLLDQNISRQTLQELPTTSGSPSTLSLATLPPTQASGSLEAPNLATGAVGLNIQSETLSGGPSGANVSHATLQGLSTQSFGPLPFAAMMTTPPSSSANGLQLFNFFMTMSKLPPPTHDQMNMFLCLRSMSGQMVDQLSRTGYLLPPANYMVLPNGLPNPMFYDFPMTSTGWMQPPSTTLLENVNRTIRPSTAAPLSQLPPTTLGLNTGPLSAPSSIWPTSTAPTWSTLFALQDQSSATTLQQLLRLPTSAPAISRALSAAPQLLQTPTSQPVRPTPRTQRQRTSAAHPYIRDAAGGHSISVAPRLQPSASTSHGSSRMTSRIQPSHVASQQRMTVHRTSANPSTSHSLSAGSLAQPLQAQAHINIPLYSGMFYPSVSAQQLAQLTIPTTHSGLGPSQASLTAPQIQPAVSRARLENPGINRSGPSYSSAPQLTPEASQASAVLHFPQAAPILEIASTSRRARQRNRATPRQVPTQPRASVRRQREETDKPEAAPEYARVKLEPLSPSAWDPQPPAPAAPLPTQESHPNDGSNGVNDEPGPSNVTPNRNNLSTPSISPSAFNLVLLGPDAQERVKAAFRHFEVRKQLEKLSPEQRLRWQMDHVVPSQAPATQPPKPHGPIEVITIDD
ncbi:hypothetical protein L596_005964 [Steinernema carpocapsae]|uniref:Uncharacterized protein n=1 Tax=Steinernema carpocapsae TaxID=34508 RepID=A0A4U8V0Y1_STECR|nr:hypothetical protein L596_005964 [Steinernema carpocapsae]